MLVLLTARIQRRTGLRRVVVGAVAQRARPRRNHWRCQRAFLVLGSPLRRASLVMRSPLLASTRRLLLAAKPHHPLALPRKLPPRKLPLLLTATLLRPLRVVFLEEAQRRARLRETRGAANARLFRRHLPPPQTPPPPPLLLIPRMRRQLPRCSTALRALNRRLLLPPPPPLLLPPPPLIPAQAPWLQLPRPRRARRKL